MLCDASKAHNFFRFCSSSRKINCMWLVATKYCWQSNVQKCVLTAEPRFVIPRQLDIISSTIRYSVIPTVIQQMEKFVWCELACLLDAYLTIDLCTNRIMASFQDREVLRVLLALLHLRPSPENKRSWKWMNKWSNNSLLTDSETGILIVGKPRHSHFARIDNTGLFQNKVAIGCW